MVPAHLKAVLPLVALCLSPGRGGALVQVDSLAEERRELVAEARALLERYGFGELPYSFPDRFNELAAEYGLAAIVRPSKASVRTPPSWREEKARADSLLEAGSAESALRSALALDRQQERYLRYRVMEALVARGRLVEALELAAAYDSLHFAQLALFPPDSTGWREWIRKVQGALAAADLSELQRNSVRLGLLSWMQRWDPAGALEAILNDTVPEVAGPALRWYLLKQLNQLGEEAPRLVRRGIETSQRIRDPGRRRQTLGEFHEICLTQKLDACSGYELPYSGFALGLTADRFLNAVYESDIVSADSVLRVLEREGFPRPSLLALIATGISRSCAAGSRCGEAVAPLRAAWLEELERFARTDGPAADTVRARLAQIWAAEDPATALTWLKSVKDPELASYTAVAAAQSAYPTDFWTALEMILATEETGGRLGSLPYDLYPRLMSLGEGATAERVLRLLDSHNTRLYYRLQWAERLAKAGRVKEARTRAFSALSEWDPEQLPFPGTIFQVFRMTDAMPELIAWVRGRPEGSAKAGALAGVARLLEP